MSLAYYELKASYAFVERNINLVKRYWGWEVVWMMYTIANSLAVVLIARGANDAAWSPADTVFPTASTAAASMTSALPGIRKPYCRA